MKKNYVVWNEPEYAKNIVLNGFGDKGRNSIDAQYFVAYWNAKGLPIEKIDEQLEAFLFNDDPYYNDVVNLKWFENCLKWGMKRKMKIREPVTITKNELNMIDRIQNVNAQKLYFVMLVMAKALRTKKGDRLFLNFNTKNGKVENSIKKIWGCRTNMGFTMHDLFVAGYIDRSEQYKMNQDDFYYELFQFDDNSEPAFIVTDFDNCVKLLVPRCNNCKCELPAKTKHSGLCPDCYKAKRKEDIKLNVRKFRNSNIVEE
jgi:hypothetical protein